MLALKTVLSELDDVPTLLFDEVDSGIGGDTATIVGRKLRRLAEHRQVVCITHLPQIAALADFHFRVEKRVDGEGSGARTRTVATALEHDARVAELSRMLGGETDASRALAHRMLASSS
jgi:DNA repair protein RecN (Recombination protein N)